MATGPIETHLHRSFNWENGAPGPREGQRGRSARCGNGLFAQCVRLRSEINLPVRGTSFTAVVGHLEACVLLGNHNTDTSHLLILEYKRDKYWQDDFEG